MSEQLFVKNQEVLNNQIFRYIVFKNSPVLTYGDVTRFNKNKRSGEYGTYQECREGDFAIRCIIADETPVISVLRCTINNGTLTLTPVEGEINLTQFATIMNGPAYNWLINTKTTDTAVLPSGLGWDGKHSRQDLIKIKKALSLTTLFLDEHSIVRYTNAIYCTSAKEYNKQSQLVSQADLKDLISKTKPDLILVDGIETPSEEIDNKEFKPRANVLLVKYKKLAGDAESAEITNLTLI